MTDTPVEKPSKGMPGWVIALIVVGAAMCFCAPMLGGAAAVLVPKIQEQQKKATCADHLRELGALFAVDRMERGDTPDDGGVRYFLRLAHAAGADGKALVCPNDPHGRPGRIVAVGDGPQDPATAPVFRAMCSYMVRDFERYPLDPDSAAPEIIAADANDFGAQHRGGINVLYSDGSVRFLDRTQLGIAADDPIIVGPDSPHPELKKLCIVPAR